MVLVCALVLGLTSFFTLFSSGSAVALPVWSELQVAGNANKDWDASAMSGNDQIALVGGNRLYIIKNNNSFSETRPAGNVDMAWQTAAINDDGDVMLAGASGRIYRSANGGTSWTEVQPAGDNDLDWRSTAISGNGQTMLAGTLGGRLYRSTNGGNTWSETQPAGNVDKWWMSLGISPDGNTVLAGSGASGRLYKSTNGGSSWAETQPAGNTNNDWRVAKVGQTGNILFAAARYGRAWVSTNGGTSWAETRPNGNNDLPWMDADISGNGQTIVIGGDGSRLYVSTNGGTSWAETQPSGAANRYWYAIEVSRDGNAMLVGAYQNRVYVSGIVGDGTFTPADSDGDGLANSIEAAAPNSGDANNDGQADSGQANVTSFVSSLTSKYISLEAPAACTLSAVSSTSESTSGIDAGFNYPSGLLNFTATCGTSGYSAAIVQYFYGTPNDDYVARKYNPTTHAYFTISGASISQTTLASQVVTKISYTAVDGGLLDTDSTANGTIVDPVGLGQVVVSAPNTGLGGLAN